MSDTHALCGCPRRDSPQSWWPEATRVRVHEWCAGNPDFLAWLHDHGIDSYITDLSETAGPFIEGDRLTVRLYEVETDETIEIRTVPLLRPPPDLHYCDTGEPFPATLPA